MIKLYFGLPGCGKTTHLVKTALKALKGKKYDNVYTNVYLGREGPFEKIKYIQKEDFGNYQLENGLVLIDEATLLFDNRSFKSTPKEALAWFLMHRHYNCDVIFYTQQWDAVDKKIRVITDRVYYMYKTKILGTWFSYYYRIPYGIIIPDSKKNGDEKLGEIVQGYAKPSLLIRLFKGRVYRPKYYKYFDSWDAPKLKPLPERYKAGYQFK